MRPARLHLTGASGSGTTTLGRAVAAAWGVPHADSDDYFWVPTSPPYVERRPPEERVALMRTMFVPREAWVLSGSMMEWGEPLLPELDTIVFLTLDPEVRLDRVRARERLRYGAAIEPGGEREAAYADFMAWNAGYDDPDFAGRNRARHEAWLAAVPCPVLRLDSARPVAELVDAVLAWDPVP